MLATLPISCDSLFVMLCTFLGTRDMSVAPILRFFEPLRVWLEKKNQENGDVPGWTTMKSKEDEE